MLRPSNGEHWSSGSWCVGVPNQLPVGQLLITRVSGRAFGVLAYAYDPEDPSARLSVRGLLDRRELPQVATNDYPWDPKDQFPAASAGHGVLFLVGGLAPGSHELCLRTDDPRPLPGTTRSRPAVAPLGCTYFTIK